VRPSWWDEINTAHTNSLFLPGAALAPAIRGTNSLADLAELPILLVVTPAQHLARVLSSLPDAPRDLVLCSKGIEAGSGRLMADVAAEAAPRPASRCCLAQPSPTKSQPVCRPP
jgi:glycerol-3-phosphate dehydrogenase (NAD(P)+)